MTVSGQMLGFNPRDHDGQFTGLDNHLADVNGARADVDPSSVPPPDSLESPFKPWRIYPKPPPPHWHWSDASAVPRQPGEHVEEEFAFEQCEIPGPGPEPREFEIDERGVYQVYESLEGRANSWFLFFWVFV